MAYHGGDAPTLAFTPVLKCVFHIVPLLSTDNAKTPHGHSDGAIGDDDDDGDDPDDSICLRFRRRQNSDELCQIDQFSQEMISSWSPTLTTRPSLCCFGGTPRTVLQLQFIKSSNTPLGPRINCHRIRKLSCDGGGFGVLVSSQGQSKTCCCNEEEEEDDAMAMRGKLPKLQGSLFKYGSKSTQVGFKTGNYKQQVVFIGGLTDGFLATDYVEPLAKALEAEKWSLVQPLFTSSYTGFGTSSLKEDAIEIEQLLNYLIDQEDSEGFILVGHSTGCQDIVHYLRTGGHCTRAVRGAILQAPVSDREFRATLPETQAMLELAEKMIKEGKAEELMPRDASPEAPITANRYRSLTAYLGDDDLFSSDFSDTQMKARLGHMSRVPCQVLFSMADEYVPESVDKVKLIKRLCDAMGGAEKMAIPWGNHSLSNRVEEAVRAMITFVKKGGPKGWDDPWG